MNIPKSRRDWIVMVCVGIATGVIANWIWAVIQRHAPIAVPDTPPIRLAVVLRLGFFVVFALVCMFLGGQLERLTARGSIGPLVRPKPRQSSIFVLEVEGTQPLNSKTSDWQFFLTNCSNQILRRVELETIRSEIGAYDLTFAEIPVMQPRQKIALSHQIFPRRDAEKYGRKKATLWDFGTDHANIRGNTYIWYDIRIQYQEADDDSVRDAGVVGVCFDLSGKILKTEGDEYYRKHNFIAMSNDSG